MRRDANDVEWQNVKKKVRELDNGQCCLCKCMTLKEIEIQKENPSALPNSILDPAHHLPVSLHAGIMYDADNIYLLCRRHHTYLDDSMNPFTGEHISAEEVEKFWQRIMETRKKNSEKKPIPTLDLGDD